MGAGSHHFVSSMWTWHGWYLVLLSKYSDLQHLRTATTYSPCTSTLLTRNTQWTLKCNKECYVAINSELLDQVALAFSHGYSVCPHLQFPCNEVQQTSWLEQCIIRICGVHSIWWLYAVVDEHSLQHMLEYHDIQVIIPSTCKSNLVEQ